MKKKLVFGLIFLLVAFGFLEAQYHFFLRANRYWSNTGLFSTDNRITSIGTNNALRTAYNNSIYAEFSVDSDGICDLNQSLTIPDGSYTLGDDADAIIAWDIEETYDCLKFGVSDAGSMSIAYMAADMIGSDISVPSKSYPSPFWYYNDGKEGFMTIGMYSIAGSDSDLMMIFKASPQNATFTWQSYQDTNDSNFMQRRFVDGDSYNWYLDSLRILWDSNDVDGGILLGLKDNSVWAALGASAWPTGYGSQIFGISNNDSIHGVHFYVDTSGDLHLVDEAGNDTTITTNGGTVTPI